MDIMVYLTIGLFIVWCATEISIGLLSARNQSKSLSSGADRLSFFAVWLSTVPPVGLAILIWRGLIFTNGLGDLSARFPWLGFIGCVALALGVSIRIAAVATLNRQFTTKVSILEKHEIVDKGIYGIIRHPAYLGHLASLLGMGLISENWVSLAALAALPPAAILYRIYVEERALLRHFGPAYAAYARRTKRLLPGLW